MSAAAQSRGKQPVRIEAVNIRIVEDQSGSVAVLFGLVLVPLFFLGGAAIDYSAASGVRAQVQRTLDEAVLAGAAAPSDQTGIAAKAFDSSIGAPKAYVTKVQFQIQNGLLTGDATGSVPTSFMRIGGTALSTISIGAHAVASTSSRGHVCFLLLGQGKTALTLSSNATLNAPGCEIDVRSTSTTAVSISSNASLTTTKLCTEGGIKGPTSPTYSSGCKTVSDPFSGKLPTPPYDTSCQYDHNNYSENAPVLVPGTFCGGVKLSASQITFQPGLYRVRGGPLQIGTNSHVIAKGVTFYFEHAASYLTVASSSDIDLSAPTSGTYAGIAMFRPPGLPFSTGTSFKGASDGSLDGLFYLPSRGVSLSSASTIDARRTRGRFDDALLFVQPVCRPKS
jgi:hypothetical protein